MSKNKKSNFDFVFTPDDVKNKYKNADLTNIDKNKICLSIGQLKLLFNLNDDYTDFKKNILEKFDDYLKNKEDKASLNFYEVTNLIEMAKRESTKKIKKENESKSEIKSEIKSDIKSDTKSLQSEKKLDKEKLNYLSFKKRFQDLEDRVKKLEAKNKKFEELLEDNYDDGDSKIDNKINLKESDESNEENEA